MKNSESELSLEFGAITKKSDSVSRRKRFFIYAFFIVFIFLFFLLLAIGFQMSDYKNIPAEVIIFMVIGVFLPLFLFIVSNKLVKGSVILSESGIELRNGRNRAHIDIKDVTSFTMKYIISYLHEDMRPDILIESHRTYFVFVYKGIEKTIEFDGLLQKERVIYNRITDSWRTHGVAVSEVRERIETPFGASDENAAG